MKELLLLAFCFLWALSVPSLAGPINLSILEDGTEDNKTGISSERRYKVLRFFPDFKAPLPFEVYLNCIKNSPKLEELYLSGFTTKDSKRPETLAIRKTQIIQISEALKGKNLKLLHGENADLDEEEMTILAASLKEIPTLETVNFMNNPKLGDKGVIALVKAIAKHKKLQELHLSRVKMTNEGALHLLTAFKSSPTLVGLSLGSNLLTYELAPKLCMFIDSCESLAVVQMRENPFVELTDAHKRLGISESAVSQVHTFLEIHRKFQLGGKDSEKGGVTLKPGRFLFQPKNDTKIYKTSMEFYRAYGHYLTD